MRSDNVFAGDSWPVVKALLPPQGVEAGDRWRSLFKAAARASRPHGRGLNAFFGGGVLLYAAVPAESINDLLGGHIPFMFDNLSSSLPQHRSGAVIDVSGTFPRRQSAST